MKQKRPTREEDFWAGLVLLVSVCNDRFMLISVLTEIDMGVVLSRDETWERLMQLKAMYIQNAEKPKEGERTSPAGMTPPVYPDESTAPPTAAPPKRSKAEKAERIREKEKLHAEEELRKEELKKDHEGTAQTHNTGDGKPKRKRRKLVDNEKLALLLWRVILDHGGSCHADTLAEYAFRDWSLLAPVVSSSPAPAPSSLVPGTSAQPHSSVSTLSSKAEPTNFARPLVPSRASLEDIKKLVHQALDSAHQIPFALLYELSNPLYLYKPMYEPNMPENTFAYHPVAQIALSDIILSYDTIAAQSSSSVANESSTSSKMDVDMGASSTSDNPIKEDATEPSAENPDKAMAEAAIEEEHKAREAERAERYVRDLRRVQFKPDPLLDGCYCLTGNSYAPPHIEGAPDEQMCSLVSVLLPIMETAVNGLHLDKITQAVISQWSLLAKYDRKEINIDMIKHAVHMTLLTHPKFEREGSMHDEFFRIVSQSRRRRSTMPTAVGPGAAAPGSLSSTTMASKIGQTPNHHAQGLDELNGPTNAKSSAWASSDSSTALGPSHVAFTSALGGKDKKGAYTPGSSAMTAKRASVNASSPSTAASSKRDAVTSLAPSTSRASARLAESAKDSLSSVGGITPTAAAVSPNIAPLPSPTSRLKRRRGEISGKETSSPVSSHAPLTKPGKGSKTKPSAPSVVLTVSNAASSIHPSIAAECGRFYGSVDILTARLRPGPGYACVGCKTKKSERWFHGPSPDEWHCATCGEAWSIEHSCPICGLVYENDDDDDDEDDDAEVDDSGDDDGADDAHGHHHRHSHRRGGKGSHQRTADSASSDSPDSSPRRVGRPAKKKAASAASSSSASKRKSARLSHTHEEDSQDEDAQTAAVKKDEMEDSHHGQASGPLQTNEHTAADKNASGTMDVDHQTNKESEESEANGPSKSDSPELDTPKADLAMDVDGGSNHDEEEEGASNAGDNEDRSAADDADDDDEEDEEQDEDDDSDDDDDEDDEDDDSGAEGKKKDSAGSVADDEQADPSSSSEAHSSAMGKDGGSNAGTSTGGRKKRKRRKSTFRKSTYPKASKSKAKRTKSLISDSLSAGMASKLSKSGNDEMDSKKDSSLLSPSSASSGPASLNASQNTANQANNAGSAIKRAAKKLGVSHGSASSAAPSSSSATQQGASTKAGARAAGQKASGSGKSSAGGRSTAQSASNPSKKSQKQGKGSAASASNQSSWIGCDDCNRWVMSGCDGIKDLSVYDDDNPNHLDYRCPLCRGHLAAMPSIFYTKVTAKFFLGDMKEAKKYICSGQFQKDMNVIVAAGSGGSSAGIGSTGADDPSTQTHNGDHSLALTALANAHPHVSSSVANANLDKSHFAGGSGSNTMNSASMGIAGSAMLGIELLSASGSGKGGTSGSSLHASSPPPTHGSNLSGSKTASSGASSTGGEKVAKKGKYAGTSPVVGGNATGGVSTRRGAAAPSASPSQAASGPHASHHVDIGSSFGEAAVLLQQLPSSAAQPLSMEAVHLHGTPNHHAANGNMLAQMSPQFVHPTTPHAHLTYGQHPVSTPVFVLNAQLAAALDPNIKFAKMESEMLKIAETILVMQQQQLKASFDLAMAKSEAEAAASAAGVAPAGSAQPANPESSLGGPATLMPQDDAHVAISAATNPSLPQTPNHQTSTIEKGSSPPGGAPPARPLPPLSDKSKHALTLLEQRFREEVLNMTSLMANSMAHMMDQHRLDSERAILTILQEREQLDAQAERLILDQFQQFAALKTQTLLSKTLGLYQQDCPALIHATAPPPHPLSNNSTTVPGHHDATEAPPAKNILNSLSSSPTKSAALPSEPFPPQSHAPESLVSKTAATANEDHNDGSKQSSMDVSHGTPGLSGVVDSNSNSATDKATIASPLPEGVQVPISSSSMDLD